MKYQVKIDDQIFHVEVLDIHERPIRVIVDGECFEIWPEGSSQAAGSLVNKPNWPTSVKNPTVSGQTTWVNGDGNGELDRIKAPIPGVLLSLAVCPGDSVQKGQELCVLEAMKMKNLIRSPRPGVIATIHVAAGQIVSHSDILMEFEPQAAAGN
jgi:biotin carboxyl carrier protein